MTDDEILAEAKAKGWPVYRCDVCNACLAPGEVAGELILPDWTEVWLCSGCWEAEVDLAAAERAIFDGRG